MKPLSPECAIDRYGAVDQLHECFIIDVLECFSLDRHSARAQVDDHHQFGCCYKHKEY